MSAKELRSTVLMGRKGQDPWVSSSESSLVFYSLVPRRGTASLREGGDSSSHSSAIPGTALKLQTLVMDS